jgi:hypothetical protein
MHGFIALYLIACLDPTNHNTCVGVEGANSAMKFWADHPDMHKMVPLRRLILQPDALLPSSKRMRSEVRRSLALVFLLSASTFGGYSEEILDPKGPIAVTERQILFNSLRVMLAIVIPTIIAKLLIVSFWFRWSKTRAPAGFQRPTRNTRLVDPATVLLVGSVAWIGALYLDPRESVSADCLCSRRRPW